MLVLVVLSFFFIRSCTQGESIVDATKNAVNNTAGTVSGAIDKTAKTAGSIAEGTVDAAKSVGEGAVDAAKTVGEGAVAVGEGAVDAAKAVGDGAVDAAKAVGEGAVDAVKAAGSMTGGIVDATGKVVNAFGQAIGEFFSWSLPGGVNVNIPKGGFEEKFLTSLKEGDLDANKAYIFDRLYFSTGSAKIDQNSDNQIDTVTKILNAYGNVKVLLRGHTDNTGSAVANKTLSLNRAQSLKNVLVEKGILAERISVQGLGSNTPVGDNSTADGRSMNRRIDISVIK